MRKLLHGVSSIVEISLLVSFSWASWVMAVCGRNVYHSSHVNNFILLVVKL